MDYLYIVNAFKQQQQQFLLHQHQLQQQLQNHPSAANPLSMQQQLDNSNMSNSLIWQPWRDLQQAAAVHHHLYRQQQQQQQQQQQLQQQQEQQLQKEARITSKELPTTAWRRERRLRTGEYHHPHHNHHHHSSPGSSTSSVRASSPSSSPPPAAHNQHSPSSSTNNASATHLHSNAHQISMMMAAAAAAGMRPLCESTNRPSPPPQLPPPHPSLAGQMHHMGHLAHQTQVLQHAMITETEGEDSPLDMSVGTMKQRNSPPPPYREPLPGSQFVSTLPRPSVITQAPPKRDVRDLTLLANRENDNRSSESIDEHFRRSLGNDYFALFAKKSPASQSAKTPSPQPQNLQIQQQQQPPAAHARTPPPALPPSSVAATALPLHSALTQSALVPPPAYPANLPPAHHHPSHPQTQALISPKPNNVLLSPAMMAAQMNVATTAGANSPPMPLVVRSTMKTQQQQQQQPLALQRSSALTIKTPLSSPQSPQPMHINKLQQQQPQPLQSPMSSTAGSRTASPLPNLQQQQQHQQQTTTAAVAVTLARFTSMENSPSSSPRHTPPVINVAVPNASPTLPAIMRIKTEPGLQQAKSHNPTPPASPTSTTNIANFCSTSNHSTPSPSSPNANCFKASNNTNTGNSSAEVLASVDDHFAKALGDTWKKLQENKDMRK